MTIATLYQGLAVSFVPTAALVQSEGIGTNVVRSCEQCGVSFVPRRSTARFCSPRCRKRSSRGTESDAPGYLPVRVSVSPGATSVFAAVATELGDELSSTALGQAALVVAARLDASESSGDSGSAVASLAKSLGDLLARLLAKAPVEVDPLAGIEDEVAKKRERRTS